MAKSYKYKPRRYKRKNKAKSRAPTMWTNLNSFNNGITDKLTTKLRYVETFRLDTTGGGLAVARTYVGNSLFQPSLTEAGQPYFYDQLKVFYKNYTVYSSKIVVKAVAITTQSGIILNVIPTAAEAFASPIAGSIQRPRSKYRLMDNGSSSSRIEHHATSRQMIPRWNANQLAETTEDPETPWYWHVIIDNAVAGVDAVADLTVEVEYLCVFSEKLNQVNS